MRSGLRPHHALLGRTLSSIDDLIHNRCDMVLKSFLEGFNPFASIQPFAAWNMAISIEENLFQQPQDAQYHKTSYVPVKQTDIWLLSCGIPDEFSDEIGCKS